jgi:hypothetical protein
VIEAKHTPVQFGQTFGADFEASTMTLQMEPGYIVAVGPVAVLPLAIYDGLLEALKAYVYEHHNLLEGHSTTPTLLGDAEAIIAKATGGTA